MQSKKQVQRVQAGSWQVRGRVRFVPDLPKQTLGTIIETNWCAVKVQWDDGQTSTIPQRKYLDLEMVRF